MSCFQNSRDNLRSIMSNLFTMHTHSNRLILAAALTIPLLTNAQNQFSPSETDTIKTFLRDNITNGCMVIGLVDDKGSQVFSGGTLDNGTRATPDGDTLFFIGSVSKTFTALLL